MAKERGSSSGYDWEDRSVPAEPEPFALPGTASESSSGDRTGEPARSAFDDGAPYGAPSFTVDPQGSAPAVDGRRRGALPPWAILAIVLVQAAALVASVGLVVGGIQRLTAEDPAPPTPAPTTEEESPSDPPATPSQERRPGTVTDSRDREVTDGTGSYEKPATIGEHTVSWPAWTDGTLAVTALEVDLDAAVPAAGGRDVLQDGYRLVAVTYEVRYEGPGQMAPAEELWLTGESDRTYFPDVGEGLLEDPMKRIGPLGSGESARFHSAFLVPEGEIDSFRLGVETFSGEILYFGTS
ncbi:hypothetical protein ACT3SP_00470 [Brachybacterium sp. AOP43-C2-M15]|uniref:hypothetical protein n=1 Tax=Brachybacterium sp. AOP43-C2-M15 TaxID=3457661 RepID=UPI004033AA65